MDGFRKEESRKRKVHDRIFIGLAFAGAALVWVIESAVHAYVFADMSFIDSLVRPDVNEAWMRFLLMGLLIVFCFYASSAAALRRSEKMLSAERDKVACVFNAMEDGIYIVNRGYDIEYINPSLEREFGPSKGRKCYEYFHGSKEACPWCPNEEVFNGRTVRWEWFSPGNGKTYDLLDTPLRNTDGSVSKLEIFRDISDRVRVQQALKESEEKYRLMIEESSDNIWIQDAGGRISFVNRRCVETSGYAFDELKGSLFEEYIVEEERPSVKKAFQKVMDGEKVSYEARGRKKDGEIIYLSVNAAPLMKDGTVVGNVSFARDVTRERFVTAELKERVAELERFMKVAITRELRIRELMDEIDRLKRERQ